RLGQVLLNLIGNAVKFTERGEIVVRATLARQGDQEAIVRFAVSDTGIGIPADKRHRLFGIFSQVDGSMTRRYGGTGLGLAISKRLVELMGGEIGVESEEGRGSTFWFTLRLARAARPVRPAPEVLRGVRALGAARPKRQQASLAPGKPRRGAARRRILLVEDDADNRLTALRLLEAAGLTADVATDGREALTAVGAAAYDLILMDVQMPN